jgi:hypothetical protein
LFWIYADRLSTIAKFHILSGKLQAKRVDFWWDIRLLHGHQTFLTGSYGKAVARVAVFQEYTSDVPMQPKVWCYVELTAPDEQSALTDGASLVVKHSARLTFYTGIPFCPGGDVTLTKLDLTEHGWIPYFKDEEFRGIDILRGPPQPSLQDSQEVEISGIRREPYYRPVIGSISHESILNIGFTETWRHIDGDQTLDVSNVRLSASEVIKGLTAEKQSKPIGLFTQVCTFYSGALTQEDAENQFVLFWAIIETLVNSITGDSMLSDDQIQVALDSIESKEPVRSRLVGALRRVTVQSFKERIRISFEQTFGVCLEDADTKITRIRKTRGKLLHPQGQKIGWNEHLIVDLAVLQEIITAHLREARVASLVIDD